MRKYRNKGITIYKFVVYLLEYSQFYDISAFKLIKRSSVDFGVGCDKLCRFWNSDTSRPS